MSWSELTAEVDAETRAQLCDPAELRPAAGGAPRVVPVMIEDDLEARGLGVGAPVRDVTIEIHVDDHDLKKGDVFVPGRMVEGVFVAGLKGWRVAAAATRDAEWQKASVEPVAP